MSNTALKLFDKVRFFDTTLNEWSLGTLIKFYASWTPPTVLLQVTERGVIVTKLVPQDSVQYYSRGNEYAKCECGATAIGHPGHARYCPKIVS